MKTYKILSITAAALLFAACANDDELQGNNGSVAATITADISNSANTRATAVENTWTAGDAIGVYATSNGITKADNKKYVTADATGNFAAADDANAIYFLDTQDVTFSAYYPYVDNAKIDKDGWMTDWTIDYSNPSNTLLAYDFLFASGASARQSSPVVNFKDTNESGKTEEAKDYRFKHKMSMIVFTVSSGVGVDGDKSYLQSITLDKIKTQGKINVKTGLTEATGTSSQTTIPVTGLLNETRECQFVLFPQKFEGNKLTVSCNVLYNGDTNNNYSATISLPNGFEGGKKYSYTIRVQNSSIEIGDATIGPWHLGASGDPVEAELE